MAHHQVSQCQSSAANAVLERLAEMRPPCAVGKASLLPPTVSLGHFPCRLGVRLAFDGPDPGRRATELELSMGKIRDALQRDHDSWFEDDHVLDCSIYHEDVCLELGGDFLEEGYRCFSGRHKYIKFLNRFRTFTRSVIADSETTCRVRPAEVQGWELRVKWTMKGTIYPSTMPLKVDAVSFYSLAAQEDAEDGGPSYRIRRHKVEFKELHPPFLQQGISQGWCWQNFEPKGCCSMGFRPLHPCLEFMSS